MGTKANKNKEIKNNKIEILNKFFLLNDEKKIIIHIPRLTQAECLKKKK
jgi:hypothetical protein